MRRSCWSWRDVHWRDDHWRDDNDDAYEGEVELVMNGINSLINTVQSRFIEAIANECIVLRLGRFGFNCRDRGRREFGSLSSSSSESPSSYSSEEEDEDVDVSISESEDDSVSISDPESSSNGGGGDNVADDEDDDDK